MKFRIAHSAPCIGDAEVEAATRVLRSGHLAQGPEVAAFEEECAALVGRKYAVAVNSGTSALHLALEALGLREGARVLAPSYGCAALATGITLARAVPALIDVGNDYNGNFADTMPPCDAVVVPHLFGARATLPSHPRVVEDIAQSIGGATDDKAIVTIASFYATKLMTTGEGGMLLTDDQGLAGAARDLRDYDNRDDFRPRYNYKMTDLQAAIGRVQLGRLPGFIARRMDIAARYREAFTGLTLRLPEGRDHVYFRFVVALPARDALAQHLNDQGIEAKRPVHRPAHHYLGGNFPNAERAHREALSLPVHPAMGEEDVRAVIEAVRSFFG